MGKFKRYDGYVMHVPQEFIDSKLPVCPFCGSDNPHWLLDSRMEMSLAGSRTYYQCERCQAIISSTAADAAAEKGKGFAINPAMAAMNAAQKGTKKQEVGVAYMRIDDLGSVCTDTSMLGQEYPITHLQEMAAPKKAFCTNCGAELTGSATFCSNCGAKQGAPVAAEPAPAPEAEPVVEAAPAPEAAPEAPVQVAPVAEPVVLEAPVAAEPAAASSWQLPLVSIILVGLAALWTFISLCRPHGFNFTGIMNFLSMAGIIVGMIIWKKEKNIIVAAGFLAMAFFAMIGSFAGMTNNIRYGVNVAVALLTFMMSSVGWLCKAAIGLTYLFAKPKLATLKTLACALALGFDFLTMIILVITYAVQHYGGIGWQIFGFLLSSIPLYLGTILYTPYKK